MTTVVFAVGQWRRGLDLVPRGHPGDGRVEVQVYALRPGERRAMRRRLATGEPPAAPAIAHRDGPRTVEIVAGPRVPLEVDGAAPEPRAIERRRRRCGPQRLPAARLSDGTSGPRHPRVRAEGRAYHRHPHAVRTGDLHRGGSRHAAAVLHEPRRSGVRAHEPARGREGRAVRALFALRQEPAPALPRRVRRRPRPHRRPHGRRDRRAAARRGAVRARVLRVRRRLRRAARRRAPRVRAGVEPAHEGARVGPADGVPRAVDALHPVRLAAARPLPLPAPVRGVRVATRRALRRPTWTRIFDTYSAMLPAVLDWARATVPEGPGRLRLRLQADDQGQGLRRVRGVLPGGDAVERRHLRHRPGVRSDAAAHAGAPAARGPHVRAAHARRAAEGHPVVPRPRRPPRPGRRLDHLSARHRMRSTAELVERHLRRRDRHTPTVDEVTLLDWDPDGEDKVLAAICYPHTHLSGAAAPRPGPPALGPRTASRSMRAYVGRPHEPAAQARPRVRAHRATASTCSATTARSATSNGTAC